MSPKVKITKAQIIQAAFDIAENEGLAQITVRKVAAALNCSVAPIYVNFENAEDLVSDVIKKAMDINMEYVSRPYTDQPFLNMGIGSIMLAYEHKKLYRDIVALNNAHDETDAEAHRIMIDIMKSDKKLEGFSDPQIMQILFTLQVFTAGLCAYASAESMPEGITLKLLLKLLEDTGNDVIEGTRKRAEK
ncbi:MAG: TetR/AcrR family transcriptional regulator [Eubacteriales bacterium]